MIGGIVMILVALWIYQSAIRAKTSNVIIWVAACAVAFYVMQFLLVDINIYILESIRAGEGGAGYEAVDGADRKNEGSFQGFGGVLESLYFELMPSILSFLAIALIRIKFITKEKISVANLFSGLGEMFQGIKKSFKTTEK